jgi:hypothetical protein
MAASWHKLASIVLLTVTGAASIRSGLAAEECIALLQHGIYDSFRELGVSGNYSQAQNEFCSEYRKYRERGAGGSASANIELFGGSASYSEKQIDALGQAMCEAEFSVEDAQSRSKLMRTTINPDAVSAFRDCVELSRDSFLQVQTNFGNPMVISIALIPPTGQSTQ